jgi:hypothetical protein
VRENDWRGDELLPDGTEQARLARLVEVTTPSQKPDQISRVRG